MEYKLACPAQARCSAGTTPEPGCEAPPSFIALPVNPRRRCSRAVCRDGKAAPPMPRVAVAGGTGHERCSLGGHGECGQASLSAMRRAFHDACHGTANGGHVHAVVVARLSAARALGPILSHAVWSASTPRGGYIERQGAEESPLLGRSDGVSGAWAIPAGDHPMERSPRRGGVRLLLARQPGTCTAHHVACVSTVGLEITPRRCPQSTPSSNVPSIHRGRWASPRLVSRCTRSPATGVTCLQGTPPRVCRA